MSDKIPLDQQIAELKRELALRANVYPGFVARGKMRQGEADLHIARMTAALHTLMWLQENETKIKAKVEFGGTVDPPAPMFAADPPKTARYKVRGTAMIDMAKGGYMHLYDIIDSERDNKVIGAKSITAETRKSPVRFAYALGDQKFDDVNAFIAAYEATLGSAPDGQQTQAG